MTIWTGWEQQHDSGHIAPHHLVDVQRTRGRQPSTEAERIVSEIVRRWTEAEDAARAEAMARFLASRKSS